MPTTCTGSAARGLPSGGPTWTAAVPRPIVQNQAFQYGIAVDATHIYWTNEARTARSGSPLWTAATPRGSSAARLRAHRDRGQRNQPVLGRHPGQHHQSGRSRRHEPGGPDQQPGGRPADGLATAQDAIYWVTGEAGTVGQANLDGTAARALVPRPARTIRKGWRWTTPPCIGAPPTAPSGGPPSTAPRPHLSSRTWDNPTGLAVSASYLYWVDNTNGTISRTALDGSSGRMSWSAARTTRRAGRERQQPLLDQRRASRCRGPTSTAAVPGHRLRPGITQQGIALSSDHVYWATVGDSVGLAGQPGRHRRRGRRVNQAGVPTGVAVNATNPIGATRAQAPGQPGRRRRPGHSVGAGQPSLGLMALTPPPPGRLDFEPSMIDFGQVGTDRAPGRRCTLANTGAQPTGALTVAAIELLPDLRVTADHLRLPSSQPGGAPLVRSPCSSPPDRRDPQRVAGRHQPDAGVTADAELSGTAVAVQDVGYLWVNNGIATPRCGRHAQPGPHRRRRREPWSATSLGRRGLRSTAPVCSGPPARRSPSPIATVAARIFNSLRETGLGGSPPTTRICTGPGAPCPANPARYWRADLDGTARADRSAPAATGRREWR